MMSRDATSRLCVTFIAMSARGLQVSWTLRNPWTTPRCQRSCHRLQYLPCSIAERMLRPLPASGAPLHRAEGSGGTAFSQLGTGKDMSLVLHAYRDAVTACLNVQRHEAW